MLITLPIPSLRTAQEERLEVQGRQAMPTADATLTVMSEANIPLAHHTTHAHAMRVIMTAAHVTLRSIILTELMMIVTVMAGMIVAIVIDDTAHALAV